MAEQPPDDMDPLVEVERALEMLRQAGRGGTLEGLISATALASIAQSLRRIENYLRRLAG